MKYPAKDSHLPSLKSSLIYLSLSFFLAFAFGCVTPEKKVSILEQLAQSEQGSMTGVFTFSVLKEGRADSIHADIWLYRNKATRVDFTYPLVGPMGSLLSTRKTNRFIVYSSRLYVVSSSKSIFINENSRLPISFYDFNAMLLGSKPKGWRCKKESLFCKKKNLTYQWDSEGRFMKLSGKSFELLFQPSRFKSHKVSATVWKLPKPKGFKVQKLK